MVPAFLIVGRHGVTATAVASVRARTEEVVELMIVVLAPVLVLRRTSGVDNVLDTTRLVIPAVAKRTSEVILKSCQRATQRACIL